MIIIIKMGIVKSKSTPSVLKSDKSIEEINEESQTRLQHRRMSDLRKHNYLFGAPKQPKTPHKHIVMTVKVDQSPKYVYK